MRLSLLIVAASAALFVNAAPAAGPDACGGAPAASAVPARPGISCTVPSTGNGGLLKEAYKGLYGLYERSPHKCPDTQLQGNPDSTLYPPKHRRSLQAAGWAQVARLAMTKRSGPDDAACNLWVIAYMVELTESMGWCPRDLAWLKDAQQGPVPILSDTMKLGRDLVLSNFPGDAAAGKTYDHVQSLLATLAKNAAGAANAAAFFNH